MDGSGDRRVLGNEEGVRGEVGASEVREGAIYSVVLSLLVTLVALQCQKKPTYSRSYFPEAAFAVTPKWGTLNTVFSVDASLSSDDEDELSELEVRWDWEGDGKWDTEYTTAKTDTHTYGKSGVYAILLETRDTDGLTNTACETVTVGGKWKLVESPTTEGLISVYFVSENDGWAVGARGTILHYDGIAWSLVTSPTKEYLVGVHFVSADDGWAVGEGDTVLHYSDGRWTVFAAIPPGGFTCVFFLSASDGWIGASTIGKRSSDSPRSYYSIYRYNGIDWSADSTGGWNIHSICFLNENNGWAVGYPVGSSSGIFHYDGLRWEEVENPGDPLYSVCFPSPNDGWAVGGGTILRCDGSEWSISKQIDCYELYSTHFAAEDEGWAVGSVEFRKGMILHYDGSDWSIVSAPDVADLYGIYFTSVSNGWAVGKDGVILHYSSDD